MEGARDFGDKAKEQASELADTTKERVSQFTDRAQHAADRLRERVSGGGEAAEDEGEPLTEQVRRGSQEARAMGRDLADVASDFGVLLQRELQLAKAEIGQQTSKAVQSVVWGASAALFAMLMLIFLFVGIMLVIGEALVLWIAAFITTGILLVLALVAGLIARQRIKQISLAPERTIESVKEDLEWARNQMKSTAK